MSDPFSGILSTVGSVFSAGSSIVGAFSSRDQANASAQAAQFDAESARENALLSRRQAEVAAIQIRRRGAAILGDQQASFAASGVTQEGSAADVRASTAANIELDALTSIYNGELKALGFDRTAALDTATAANARRAGNLNLASGLIGAIPGAIDAGKSVFNLVRKF